MLLFCILATDSFHFTLTILLGEFISTAMMKALRTGFFFGYTLCLFRAAGTAFKYLIARDPFSFAHLRARCNLCLYFWSLRELLTETYATV